MPTFKKKVHSIISAVLDLVEIKIKFICRLKKKKKKKLLIFWGVNYSSWKYEQTMTLVISVSLIESKL